VSTSESRVVCAPSWAEQTRISQPGEEKKGTPARPKMSATDGFGGAWPWGARDA